MKSSILKTFTTSLSRYQHNTLHMSGGESTKASLTLIDKNSESHILQISDLSKVGYLNEPILFIKQEELALVSKNKEKVRGEYLKELGILNTSLGYEHITDTTARLLSQIENKNELIEEIQEKSEFVAGGGGGVSLSEYLQNRISKLKDTIQKTSSNDTKEIIDQLVKMLGVNRKYRIWLENPGFSQIENQVSGLNEIIDTFNKRVVDIGMSAQLSKIDASPISEEFKRIKASMVSALQSNEQAYLSLQAKLKERDITEDIPVLLKSLEGSQNELVQFEQFMTDYTGLTEDILAKRTELTSYFDCEEGEIYKTLLQRIGYVDEKYKEFCESRSESEVFTHMFDGISVKADIFFNHKKLLKDIEQCYYSGKSGNLSDRIFGKNNPNYKDYLKWVHEDFWDFYDYSLANDNLMTRLDGLKVNGRTRLLEVVFSKWHEYINVSTSIEHDFSGPIKEISKMSTGELATVLLKLRLATIGLSKQIILLDQPEDHLDNSFIAHGLVDLLKILKKNKQVIIATHNANLIIGADAEQIVIATDINQRYESGSIENPNIRKQIIGILEGGQDAFDRRSNRYNNQIAV